MENLFNPQALNGMPWAPAAYWQMLSNWQQAWLHLFMPGGRNADEGGLAGLMQIPGWWASSENLLAALMPFMPRIEANITPLKTEGSLADANDAARITMRMTVPGLGGQAVGEVLLVDAVVARAVGEDRLRLGSTDLPAALPKQD